MVNGHDSETPFHNFHAVIITTSIHDLGCVITKRVVKFRKCTASFPCGLLFGIIRLVRFVKMFSF